MIIKSYTKNAAVLVSLLLALVFFPMISDAQKMRHGGGGGGGGNRGGGGGGAGRNVSRPASNNKPSINGGSQRNPNRNNNLGGNNRGGNNNIGGNNRGNNNIGSNNRGSGNKVNIDNSKRNVNINVDNSKNVNVRRNTVVRSNRVAYPRPPYRYGGRSFYCYHPYVYHPFRPFYWGPVWHPWGFFIATLATTAIVISVENQKYHYDQGVYYVQSSGGYTVVEAPVGATIKTLPANSQTVVVNETTNNYYYGGTYYEKSGDSYKVVPPTAGSTVENLPEGSEEVKVGDQTYVKYGETYYMPVEVNGKKMYEVADIKEEDK